MKLISRYAKFIFLVMITFALASCLSPVKTEQRNIYSLTCSPLFNVKARRSSTLLVMPPETETAYNTTQMAYSTLSYQISYFSKNRWSGTPSQMFQPLIVQALQNTHYFHAVITPPLIARYDYILNTRIIKIQQDFTTRPAMFVLIINAQLNSALTNRVIATKQFVVNRPMPMYTPYGGVIAGNDAATIALRQIAEFTMRNAR